MKKIIFLSFFWGIIIHAQNITLDYSTGKNEDGTLMIAPPPDVANGFSVLDPDWTVVRPGETVPVTTKTRHTYTGWSYPITGITGNTLQSRWITDKDAKVFYGDGYFYYYSKDFTIPLGATAATINLRSLSFVRNWTYLVRTDVTPNTEELITQTTWMSDGAKGWLNSRSPEVVNKQLISGATYKIKVKLYTNNTSVTNALNVNCTIKYTPQACSSPLPNVESPINYCQNNVASPLAATGTGLLWYNSQSGGIGTSSPPTPDTSIVGTTSYYVSQTVNGCESARAKIDVIVNSTTLPNVESPINYCQNNVASPLTATGTGLLWYNSQSGGIGTSSPPTPDTSIVGTTSYYVSQTVNGCESARAKIDAIVNSTTLPNVESPINYCQNNVASPLTATGTGLLWYNSQTGGIGTSSPPTPDTSIVGTTSYYVSQTVNGCESARAKIDAIVNPIANILLTSGSDNQNVEVNTSIQEIVYTFNNATNISVSGLPSGIISTINGNILTLSGTPSSIGVYNYSITTIGGCENVIINGKIEVVKARDWKLAPNSYIFDTNNNNNGGLYIPVKKAFAMWSDANGFLNQPISIDNFSAYVYWEDNSGIISSDSNYKLEIIGSGENAKIKVPIDKSKGEGNALISFHVGSNGNFSDPIYWSWHVWVTDDPTNGSDYRQGFETRRRNDGTTELIPNSDWKWMDRNLGAVNKGLTGDQWKKSGGLMYQWGRKDPIPPLARNTDDFYEVQGAKGRFRHTNAINKNGAADFNSLILNSSTSVLINEQIKQSIKNPLSLLYINLNYNNNLNLPYNWFGVSNNASYPSYRLARLNLWSDNSKGMYAINGNDEAARQPYQTKSSYDPCPNGWRIPSMMVPNTDTGLNLTDIGIRLDYSPFGIKNSIESKNFETSKYHIIKPTDISTPNYMQGFKLYNKVGFDLSNVNGNNMGLFPGTGLIAKGKVYTDQHENLLWTATMMSWYFSNTTPHVEARSFRMIPDGDQVDVPDPSLPSVKGRYQYFPVGKNQTSDALACRCIKDPLYVINEYDFATEYFLDTNVNYTDGLYNPNTYTLVKSENSQTIEIPISKAFSVNNQILSNHEILAFDNLKVNIDWTTNQQLISNVSINQNPSSIQDIINSKIIVNVSPYQSGSALITLHNGSIDNPIYWSWHIWVTNSSINSIPQYVTETPTSGVTNYINYVSNNSPLVTEFMDRNIGAIESFPTVINPDSPTSEEINKISQSGGFLYQYGRKDPLPVFVNPDGSNYIIYKGRLENGIISYQVIDKDFYKNNFINNFNNYSSTIVPTDKKYQRIGKVLKYSINNPLKMLVPSSYTSTNNIAGTDWISEEQNVAENRWGLGERKSIFDPCPEGWRIPDIISGSSDNKFQYGTTPWYKLGVNETVYNTPISSYNGQVVKSGNTILGYQFTNSNYLIGNYPFVGIRGFRANGVNLDLEFKPSDMYSGIWTSGFSSHYKGYGNGVLYDNSNAVNVVQIQAKRNFDPYMALSCRCARIKKDSNGIETGPIQKLPMSEILNGNYGKVLNSVAIKEKIINSSYIIFPNPVKDILFIDVNEKETYYYKIFDFSGKLIKEGKFINSQTDLSVLKSGNYIIAINNYHKVFKIIKK